MKIFSKIPKNWYIITGVFFLISITFYIYLYFNTPLGFGPLYRNWDGPSYIVIAKSLYNSELIEKFSVIKELHKYYYAAHFPLYPFLIRIFSFLGYYQATIFIAQVFTLFSAIAIYEFFKLLKLRDPLTLALCFLIFTPRWFVVNHTGSSEPMFMFFFIMFLINFFKGDNLKGSLWAMLAQFTRSQGILIFVGVGLYRLYEFLIKRIDFVELVKSVVRYFTVPLALILVFTLYYFQFGTFFAFFKALENYGHIGTPFRMFGYYNESSIIFPLEVMIFSYLLYGIAVFKLISEKAYKLAAIAIPFFIPIPLLNHLDVSRYAIPLLPFIFVAYNHVFGEKYVKLAMFLSIPATMVWAAAIIVFNQSI